MATNILELTEYVQKQGDIGRQQGMGSRLAGLAKQAYGAPRADQQAIVGEAVGVDPRAGFQLQDQLNSQEDRRTKQLGNMARMLVGAPETMRPQLYQQMRPELASLGLESVPDQYGPEIDGLAQQLAAVYGGASGKPEGFTLGPGAARYGADGKLIAEQPFAPSRPEYQLYDSAKGPVWLPKPGAGLPQQGAAATVPGGFGIEETDNYVRKILGNAGQIDPNAAPEQIVQQLLPHVIQQESGGNPNAVSPKGAQGLMQVMPETGRDPGFGVAPLRGPDDNVRFGRDYLTAMVKRYPGRPDLALAAYNAGYGVADRFASPTASSGAGVGAIPISGVTPKPRQESEETFSQPQVVTNPATGKQELVQFGNRGGRRVVNDYAPPPTTRDAKPPTEGERNAAGYLSRMESAERDLMATVDAGYDPGNVRDYTTAGQGPLLNWAASDMGQQYRQQQEDWVRAKLRKESGAVIGDDEMEREIKVYFPQPGDGKNVIAKKAKSREVAIEAMRKSAGRAVENSSSGAPSGVLRYNPETGDFE